MESHSQFTKFSYYTLPELQRLLSPNPIPERYDTFSATDIIFKDWRTERVLRPVKDEGDCDSSWAFAAVEAIESEKIINGGAPVDYSEQQIVDCVKGVKIDNDECCHSCKGGRIEAVFQYMQQNETRMCLNEKYPYIGQE